MRKLFLTLAATATVVSAGVFTTTSNAMTLGNGLQGATGLVEQAQSDPDAVNTQRYRRRDRDYDRRYDNGYRRYDDGYRGYERRYDDSYRRYNNGYYRGYGGYTYEDRRY
jgi:hypothetical protein